jgi:hypothetical protein
MSNDFADYYLERTISASKEQGIDDLIIALEKNGITATSEQTGGFTMCAFFKLKDNKYIYANTTGAGVYDEEGFETDLINLDDSDIELVAKTVAEWIKVNN